MTWLYLAVGVVCSSEMLVRLPFRKALDRLSGLCLKIRKILLSDAISDHWKEKCLPQYALQLLVISLQVPAMILLAVVPLGIILYASKMAGHDSINLVMSPHGLIFAAVISIIYLLLRSGFAQRIL